ncbi:MAG: ATP-grasp domain-containing protein [Planctomycetes bacterium]|nr:ATP-grasp domain-containing protein [Planctomycetota bacterium]MCB9891110.1 ATP-grasp domain-containing protein [Planctomycetota bacterium]MCB9918878.1 ATP-grasp domain-containing protein [Planctomycetota bacterium]
MTRPAPLFDRILVANRGEIAVRVLRGIRELGTTAIAVCSEADRDALHVRTADEVHVLGPAEPSQSYLAIDKILDAARRSRAQAIHPGYGFLSENPAFARACTEEGFVFIGPTADQMEALGSKRHAKELAQAAGVPCVPGFDGKDEGGDNADEATFVREAARIGFPLLVKASAGGGGRGMRLVHAEKDFVEALRAGQREALQAFGDDSVLLERYVHPARHIEVQIFGDGEHAIALGERECSVQRRHQKVLEESPSPVVDDALRQRLEEAAVALARHVGYRNAGTVEFLVGPDLEFYFLEVNTRLQVEHPVTELVTGLDLVHLQIAIAAGRDLASLVPGHRVLRGHAIEARICAEDAEHGFLPATGPLTICQWPAGPGIRVDTGFDRGSAVSPHYDSMIAKLIVSAPNRAMCLMRLEQALRDTALLGVITNVDFLRRVATHPAFVSGDLRTDFLDVHPECIAHEPAPADALCAAALATVFARGGQTNTTSGGTKGQPSPWDMADAFRIGGAR